MKKICYICKKTINSGLKARMDGPNKYAHETCLLARSDIVLTPKNVPQYSSAAASGMSKADAMQAIAKNIIGEVNE